MTVAEIINTYTTSVSCCGREAPFDHPKVYLEIDSLQGNITCSYCGKKFILNR